MSNMAKTALDEMGSKGEFKRTDSVFRGFRRWCSGCLGLWTTELSVTRSPPFATAYHKQGWRFSSRSKPLSSVHLVRLPLGEPGIGRDVYEGARAHEHVDRYECTYGRHSNQTTSYVSHGHPLQDVIGLSVVHPTWAQTRPVISGDVHRGWQFVDPEMVRAVTTAQRCGTFSTKDCIPDTVEGRLFVRDLYEIAGTHGSPVITSIEHRLRHIDEHVRLTRLHTCPGFVLLHLLQVSESVRTSHLTNRPHVTSHELRSTTTAKQNRAPRVYTMAETAVVY
eukprot:5163417-Pyramimonas_sp.AAC.3